MGWPALGQPLLSCFCSGKNSMRAPGAQQRTAGKVNLAVNMRSREEEGPPNATLSIAGSASGARN